MENYKICLLTKEFYSKYPESKYGELLKKENRPYLVLLIEIDERLYGIPFRSHINHKYCFKIVNDRGLKEGLDYTKAVVLQQEDIGRTAHVRPNTIPQIDGNIKIIRRDFSKFLMKFKQILSGEKKGKTERQILEMSTLKYFL